MLTVSHWKEWYDIIPRRWIFLEAGEAKTLIDSHHAQVIILLSFYYILYLLIIACDFFIFLLIFHSYENFKIINSLRNITVINNIITYYILLLFIYF